MRVLHLDSGREWRGGQQQVLLLASGLAQSKTQQHLLVQRKGSLALKLEGSGLPFTGIAFSSELNPLSLFRLCCFIRTYRPDLIHAHDSRTLGLAVLAKHWISGWKLAASRRVIFPVSSNRFWRWKYVKGADRIIAVSNQIKSQLVREGIDPFQVSVVYDGFPGAALKDKGTRETARQRWNISPDEIVIGAIGNFTQEKGHDYLLRAWPEIHRVLPSTRLWLVGDGPLRTDLENLSRHLGVADSIHFAGFQWELTQILPVFDAFVYPSLQEGLGSTLLLAMNHNIPVCASATGGIPEVVIDGETGLLFPPGDSGALARVVLSLLENPLRAGRLVQNAAEHVKSNFRVEQMVEGTSRVYRELLASRSG